MEDETVRYAREYLAELKASEQAGNPPGDGYPGALGRVEAYLELALERIEARRGELPPDDRRAAVTDDVVLRALYDAHHYRMDGSDPDDIAMADEYATALAARGGLGDIRPADRIPLSPDEADAIERVNNGEAVYELPAPMDELSTADAAQEYTLSPDEAKAIEDMRANTAYEAAETDAFRAELAQLRA